MKKRVLSLALILSLLLLALPLGPLSTAEEQEAELVEPAEPFEEIVVEPDIPEEPAVEAPEEPEALEAPEEELVIVEPEEEPIEAPSVTEAPEAELPAADAATPEPSQEHPILDASIPEEEADAPELFSMDAPIEADAGLRDAVALGSDGVQYAGVAYLSQAAFNSLNEQQQDDYVAMVDDLTGMLDRGMVVEHPVFSLDEDGLLSFDYAMPLSSFAGEAAEAPELELEALEPEVVELEEGPVLEEESDAAPEEIPASEPAAEAEPTAEPEGPIVENVELAERYRVPIERIDGWQAPADDAADGSILRAQSYNTLFWNSDNNYYRNQLDATRQRYYDAAKREIIDEGKTGFHINTDSLFDIGIYAADALSALMQAYPEMFDWLAADGGFRAYYPSDGKGGYDLEFVMDESPHYTASLEQQARAKVKEIVADAVADAQKNYPHDIDYGIVRYLDSWICERNYYNLYGTYTSQMSTDVYYYCHRSYGVLLKGYGVCESYALAMSRLLDAAGIPNLYVVGDAGGGGHAWNYVHLSDGNYYLQDSTWNDDPNPGHTISDGQYLLCGDDGQHKATGQHFENGDNALKTFSFPGVSSAAYVHKTTPQPGATPRISPLPTHPVIRQLPTSFKLNKTKLTLGAKGGSAQLKVQSVKPSNADAGVLEFKSSKKSVATVSESGVVKAGSKTGTATITATTANGKKATCQVTVVNAPSKITLNSTKLTLAVGQKEKLKASVPSGSAATLTWESSDEGVATVSGGTVRAVGTGSAVITVKAHNYNGTNSKLRKTCRVTVQPEPELVELSAGESIELGKGEVLQLSPVAKSGDEKVTAATFTYESSDSSVASVSKSGKLTAKKLGTAQIEIEAYNGTNASIDVTVRRAPTKVKISNNPKTLGVGEVWTLGAKLSRSDGRSCAGSVTFKSSNSKVLSVGKRTGKLTAKSAGTAKITATAYNKISKSVTITVKKAPTGIKLDKYEILMGVGEQRVKLKASFRSDKQYGHVTWSSSNEDAVSVSNGVLTANGEGFATVTASVYRKGSEEPYTADCDVTVSGAQ